MDNFSHSLHTLKILALCFVVSKIINPYKAATAIEEYKNNTEAENIIEKKTNNKNRYIAFCLGTKDFFNLKILFKIIELKIVYNANPIRPNSDNCIINSTWFTVDQ
jgi:hypothetical protein